MTDATPIDGDAEPVSLKQALETRYLAYALSTITNRALPDVRDGLKPRCGRCYRPLSPAW